MPKIFNDLDDKDLIVSARNVIHGRDGEPVTVPPGQTATIKVDGDHQLIIQTTGRAPEDEVLAEVPVAVVEGDGASEDAAGSQLGDADDDVVRGEIVAMLDEKKNLTQGGKPELPELNKRLEDKGFGPVDSKRRDALMPAPASAS